MSTAALPHTLDRLVAYLVSCGGCDRFEFHDWRNDPDPLAARDFAESVRKSFADHLGVELDVKQVANRVTLRALDVARP